MSTTISTKGQVVIPLKYRQALGLIPGTQVDFDQDGVKLVLHRVKKNKHSRVEDGYWMAHYKGKRIALEDWDKLMGTSMRSKK